MEKIKKILSFLWYFIILFLFMFLILVFIVESLPKEQANSSFASFMIFGISLILIYISYKIAHDKVYGSSITASKKDYNTKVNKDDIKNFECVKNAINMMVDKCKETKEEEIINNINKCVSSAKQPDKVIKKALYDYIQESLNDGLLDENEECIIASISKNYNIDLKDNSDLYNAKILYSIIVKHEIPNIELRGNVPVILGNNEVILYLKENVSLIKEVTRTKYVGGTDGFSIRIAKGLYYRKGAFKGERVKVSSKEVVDNGMFIISSKNLFFIGESEKKKIPIKSIITSEPFENGITIQKNGNAKPLTFYGIDSWFAHNLIINLPKI
ncbi:hypothetical protein [Nitrosophilus kaiyonis]|uniref:hypothetical protein n=1 Tax=Nitrosophilus kaiyonis TaxID=2930200 RepID=UPI0024905041|nr:hypothetical protein [Nitrosophilus kaiyonis]